MTSADSSITSGGAAARIIAPMFEAKGWVKFLAVMAFIYGGFAAITIFGLIIAWLPIWIGVLLWQFASKAEAAHQLDSETDAIESLRKLKMVFIIQGVALIVVLAFYALLLVALLAGGLNFDST